jgi:glucokinase
LSVDGIVVDPRVSSLPLHVLLGDIGATNARFAILANGVLGPVRRFDVANYPQFADVVTAFLNGSSHRVTHALLAVAGPIDSESCALTNCSWTIDAHQMRQIFSLEARLVNDFEATALSLPNLTAADLCRIGTGRAIASAPTLVLGPGTGLGVACLIPDVDNRRVIASEGGHATLAGMCGGEDAIIKHLRRRFGHVSAEREISGGGLENIYQAIGAIDGRDIAPLNAAEITESALAGRCQTAYAALKMFCAFLGSFAGSVALTFGAQGGVYIAGGIAPRIVDFIAQSEFRERFEAKGRFQTYLEAIPTSVIMHPAATFLGLKSLIEYSPGRATLHF